MANNTGDFIYNTLLKSLATENGDANTWDVIDNVSRSMGYGSQYSRMTDILYGFNRTPTMMPVPPHREAQGLVLFTKPNLNLSYDNISYLRELSFLFPEDPQSYQYAVRMMLDPTTAKAITPKSYLTDENNPYIVPLTNCIRTLSPPPDQGIELYTSPEGNLKSSWIMNDSISAVYGKYEQTAVFDNPRGNIILLIFYAWLTYMSAIRIGPAIPHPGNRYRDEMDYFTRIERFKLDTTGRYIVSWFHTGASVPTNVSIGANMAYDRSESVDTSVKTISIQFTSVGAIYNDPIQLLEFNLRIQSFNPKMANRAANYVKIPKVAESATQYYGYPYINLATNELEWWVEQEILTKLTRGL